MKQIKPTPVQYKPIPFPLHLYNLICAKQQELRKKPGMSRVSLWATIEYLLDEVTRGAKK